MCGIVGIAGKSSKQNDNVLGTLLILDAVRGIDSTGVAGVSSANAVDVAKAVGNPYELIGSRQYDRVVGGVNRAIIGHNRWATQGGVNKRNAHPFEFETIVGVHNGTLTNKWELLDAKDYVVDSENLYHHMEKKGLDHLMGVMKGAWSLVWWDKTAETLNFLRNKERPMFTCYDADYKSMYWASEYWMLDVALARHGVERTAITATEEDKLYAHQIDENRVIYEPYTNMHPSRAPVYVAPVIVPHIVPLGGQVDTPSKKHFGHGTKQVIEDEKGYTGTKNVVLEVLASCIDRYGAAYYSCFDVNEPLLTIRLYTNSRGVGSAYTEGDAIMADIGHASYSEPATGAYPRTEYYKVLSNSVVLLDDIITPLGIQEEIQNELDAESSIVYFTDPKGKKKATLEWVRDHGTCAVCSGHVNPTLNFRFATDHSSICHECVETPETAQLVSYLK